MSYLSTNCNKLYFRVDREVSCVREVQTGHHEGSSERVAGHRAPLGSGDSTKPVTVQGVCVHNALSHRVQF